MNEREQKAIDHYLTTPPEEFYKEYADDEPTTTDDEGTEIDKKDFVFIAYYLESKFIGDHSYSESYRRYVLVQDNFLDLLERKGTAKLDTSKLEIISGKDWIANV